MPPLPTSRVSSMKPVEPTTVGAGFLERVDPHSSEFAAMDRGGPWDDPKFHRNDQT
jgi:hypothetical protein